MVDLLVKAGADLNKDAVDDGSTSLHAAAYEGHRGVAEVLAKAGANLDKATVYECSTPLCIAAEE